MPLPVDSLLDRLQLKSRLRFWRILAIVALVAVLASLGRGGAHGKSGGFGESLRPHIARLKIEGVITDDPKRLELIDELAKNSRVKAVILSIDSPGGTASGGQELYLKLLQLGKKKPVIACMRGMAASGGYMTALAADRIYAREGTITGSIGVILQMAEFTELAKKLGVEPITVKSGPYKASPNPLEKFSPAQREQIQSVIDDFHRYFKTITAERRHLPYETVTALAQGQVYSGSQAVKNKLVDALGGEEEAQAWLAQEKKLPARLPILDAEVPKEEDDFFDKISALASGARLSDMVSPSQGLMAIWK